MYLQCTGSVHHPSPPVYGASLRADGELSDANQLAAVAESRFLEAVQRLGREISGGGCPVST
jgi:hypothetical protein